MICETAPPIARTNAGPCERGRVKTMIPATTSEKTRKSASRFTFLLSDFAGETPREKPALSRGFEPFYGFA
jgi:hypothetical protein